MEKIGEVGSKARNSIRHTSHQSAHQCATWTIKSKELLHPIHIPGVYVNPNGKGDEDFYQTLEQQSKSPPTHTHAFTGDFNAHVAEELEEALSTLPAGTVPQRKGDITLDATSRLCHTRPLPTWALSRAAHPPDSEEDCS